jgi:hypothetical protein
MAGFGTLNAGLSDYSGPWLLVTAFSRGRAAKKPTERGGRRTAAGDIDGMIFS